MPLSQEILDAVKHFIFGLDHVVWNWPSIMPIMVVALLSTGIITTFRLSWIQIRRFWHGVRVLKGDYDDPEHEGDLSHFQALSTALSGTIGIGNIAGVATAIHYGGPGALFWMWVTAVFGMALKFTECTLAQWFRKVNDKGQASGGPMYYIEQGLGPKWKWMAVAFACFAAITPLGMGDAVQSFTVADQFRHDFGVPTLITGIVIVLIVGAVILGGIRRIGKVTSKLVPFMCAVYILAGLIVLLLNANEVIPTLGLIFRSAFQPAAQIGGFAGGGFIFMMTWGVKRGLFSNESGLGSAPIIHAAAKTDQPVREGVVAMLGPFVDTLTVCSITGLVILTTGVWNQKSMQRLPVSEQSALVTVLSGTHVHKDGVLPPEKIASGTFRVDHGRPEGFEMVRNNSTLASMEVLRAKGHFLDSGVKPFSGTMTLKSDDSGDPAAAVFRDPQGHVVTKRHMWVEGKALQNGSPLTSWAFQKGLGKLAGGKGNYLITLAVFLFAISTSISVSYYGDRSVQYLFGDRAIMPYRVVFCIMSFLGAIYSLRLVWSFSDIALGCMAFPNLIAILLLTGKVKKRVRTYVESGKLRPPHAGEK